MTADPSTLRLAFLGCGAIARYHLDGITEDLPRGAAGAPP